jgi:hypothetical protein
MAVMVMLVALTGIRQAVSPVVVNVPAQETIAKAGDEGSRE